ncbi:sigma-70 family RNA polymerase sigma factor [Micromonospora sp. ATA51]|uniref:sigma-70 family RNA polymerase sigma factor n=1 Tax=Micromonospora sp. ATA51 TaxID=2806098 RepID=UPI001EE40223|nr:sigma-70 family RNA polymerase sigma factor [Micromonospora sp. ATA51]
MTVISEDFDRRTRPYRRELLAHCYRMLGSVHEAEDLVQETLLRAWRAFDRYDPDRASLRTWLHRIATNACLTALRGRARRPLPSDLVAPNPDPDGHLVVGEVPWLQPVPDALLDPATVVVARGSLRLALVAALQLLPARQRAILILRDVLGQSAAEVAETLATTPAAVNSGLQRARARLGAVAVREEQVAEPADPDRRALVDRYVAAFERADVAALTRLLTADAVLEMPPVLNWYAGRERYGRFIARVFAMRGTDWRMLPTAANGQPALAAYVRDGNAYVPHTLQVLTVDRGRISRNVVFQDRAVFAAFGLTPFPATVPVS